MGPDEEQAPFGRLLVSDKQVTVQYAAVWLTTSDSDLYDIYARKFESAPIGTYAVKLADLREKWVGNRPLERTGFVSLPISFRLNLTFRDGRRFAVNSAIDAFPELKQWTWEKLGVQV